MCQRSVFLQNMFIDNFVGKTNTSFHFKNMNGLSVIAICQNKVFSEPLTYKKYNIVFYSVAINHVVCVFLNLFLFN